MTVAYNIKKEICEYEICVSERKEQGADFQL